VAAGQRAGFRLPHQTSPSPKQLEKIQNGGQAGVRLSARVQAFYFLTKPLFLLRS
jgi:hypothetical protein